MTADQTDLTWTTRIWLVGTWPFTLTFGWFWLMCWPLIKSKNYRKGLSCLVFRAHYNFELHLFIWSSEISQLAHSSSWFFKGIFKGSSHAYPTSSLHRASALSLREGVRDILDILAQCNRSKPASTCTSNLRFSRLYILMLWFIITQVIILHSYTIKDIILKGFL